MKGVGIYRLIIMLALLWIICYILLGFLQQARFANLASIIVGIILFGIHSSRKDKYFLKHVGKNVYFIYCAEYLLLSLPVLLAWLFMSNWLGMFINILLCMLIPLAHFNLGMQNTTSILKFLIHPFHSNLNFKLNLKLPFIPIEAYEWISGIRRNFVVVVPIYLVILSFSFKPLVAPIGMIILSLINTAFYYQGESREFIELVASGAKQFILRKIAVNFKCMSGMFLPIIIMAIIFQYHLWYYIIGSILISLFIQVITIIFKYALFEENANLNRNSTIVSLNVFFTIVPLFWPIPLIMGTRYYFKAQQNLKKYFNA